MDAIRRENQRLGIKPKQQIHVYFLLIAGCKNLPTMNENEAVWKEWKPFQHLNDGTSLVILILNCTLKEESKILLRQFWPKALLRIAVDGGLCQVDKLNDNGYAFIPDIICGDFDSLPSDLLDSYAKKGVDVIHTPDQDETDFTKALKICYKSLLEKKLQASAIFTFCENEHRLDHIMANLNTLYVSSRLSPIPVYLISDHSLTWLLDEGKHRIIINQNMKDSHVGLVPLGEPCLHVTTTGLFWNLSDDQMKFGDMVSTSNKFDGSNCVTVVNDKKLIWTMEIFVDRNKINDTSNKPAKL